MEEIIDQISTTEAMQMAKEAGIKITRPTMVNWIDKYGIGHRLGTGRYMVYKNKFVQFLNGRKDANAGAEEQ